MGLPRHTHHLLLVYHSGALGDFVTTLPALKLLSRSAPLALWTRPPHAQLAAGAGLSIAGHHDVGSPDVPPVAAERAFLFAANGSSLPATLRQRGMAVHAHAPRPTDGTKHVVDFHAAAAADVVGASYSPGSLPQLTPLPQWHSVPIGQFLDDDDKHVTRWVLAPGSGSFAKNWPIDRFVAVADALCAASATVAWLLGPAEEERGIAHALPAGATVWAHVPITQVATLLVSSDGYVGNDSGTSHLAAALGVPTVALFGPTDPAVWAPRGPAVTVIAAAALDEIAVDAVVDACGQLVVGAD